MITVTINIGYRRDLILTVEKEKIAKGILRQVEDAIRNRQPLHLVTSNGEWLVPYHEIGITSITEVADEG